MPNYEKHAAKVEEDSKNTYKVSSKMITIEEARDLDGAAGTKLLNKLQLQESNILWIQPRLFWK